MLSQDQQGNPGPNPLLLSQQGPHPPELMPRPLQIPHSSTGASLQPVLVNPVLQRQQVGRTLHREEALCCKESPFKASILPPMDTDRGPNQGALSWTVAPAAACLAQSCTGRSLTTQDLLDQTL